ncbi:unnamed protein product [Nippostrongylus brasiliensis]|uniref:Vezatin domain-containing protein n=1 Tax=Nippostrongylus brasiliensis TaxID=27835 RepID=A0A0N4XVY5_NIPBR|nr:unnamed protein product [Nippostrongylus brasiliensis]
MTVKQFQLRVRVQLRVPSLGESTSRHVLQECQELNLLEEVDEEDITARIAVDAEHPTLSYGVAFTSSFCALVLAVGAASSVRISICLSFAVLLLGVGLYALVNWRLKMLIHAMKRLDAEAKKANQAVLQREALSLGNNIYLFSSLANELVSESFMEDEKPRLIKSFYTEEMDELVHSSADLHSSHITQRGIGIPEESLDGDILVEVPRIPPYLFQTLLDLFVLHRSEVLRLLVLYLFRAHFRATFRMVFHLVFVFASDVNSHAARLTALQSTLSYKKSDPRSVRSNWSVFSGGSGLEQVALSLEDITIGIMNDHLSVDEVKRALQRVLSMSVFCESKGKESSAGEVPLSQSTIAEPLTDESRTCRTTLSVGVPLRDEVFEAIALHDDFDDFNISSTADDVLQKNRQLMEELRMALADRATDFAARERRALASFYGVTDEELKKIESAQETSCIQAPNSQMEYEGVSCDSYRADQHDDVDHEESAPRTERLLPSDLLAALRHRTVAEETIGDDD